MESSSIRRAGASKISKNPGTATDSAENVDVCLLRTEHRVEEGEMRLREAQDARRRIREDWRISYVIARKGGLGDTEQ